LGKKVFIYDSDDKRVALVKEVLDLFHWEMIRGKNFEQIGDTLDVAIVSMNLPPVKINGNPKLVLIIDPQEEVLVPNGTYDSFITLVAPISKSEIYRVLERLGDLVSQGSSYLGRITDLKIAARYFSEQIKNETISLQGLAHSLEEFCLHRCDEQNKLEGAERDKADSKNILSIDEVGQIKVCKKKSECPLRKFLPHIRSELERGSLSDELPVDSSILPLGDWVEKVDGFIGRICLLKKKFCLKECATVSHDLGFKTGDILLSDFRDIIQGNCSYCSYADCKLNYCFRYFVNLVTPAN